MGNSNTRKYNINQQYASQHDFTNIIEKQCIKTTSCEEWKPWSKFSRKIWSENTLKDPFNLSKTAWPVPRFEAIFQPEFPIRETVLKNDFIFINFISKGGYSKVYKVQNIKNKQIFALKVIDKAKIVAENGILQIKQEVDIQRAVGHHTFIANLICYWQGRKTLYLLSEFISGGELFSLVQTHGPLPEEVVRIYIAEIALALDFLHNAGVIYRDLKASNILLDNEGHAKLIDFGFGKWLPPFQKTRTFCGTFEYMAPEIVKKQNYGHEVDWWSLGVLTCFLLLNEYPKKNVSQYFRDNTDYEGVNFGFIPEDMKSISPEAIDLLQRLMQVEPTMRIKSILALQRIAFYMNHDIRSFTLKKVSPYRFLDKKLLTSTENQEYKEQ